MKRNILRAAVAASIFGFSGAAFAESVDVPFSGTVANACSITKTSDGVLALDFPNHLAARLMSDGIPGVIEVTCAGAGTISVDAPVATGTTTINGTTESFVMQNTNGAGPVKANSEGTTSTHPAGTTSYGVSMSDYGGPDFTPGTYTYAVTVTITPN
jgi:hypothetical protein